MSVQHAGSIIRQARLNAGLTQEQLSDGVCSTLSLSRIENGSAGVSPATFQTLMAHAGIFCEAYPTFSTRADFDCFYALKKVRFYLDSWQLTPACQLLDHIEMLNWADNKFYYQEWLLLHCKLQLRSGHANHAHTYELVRFALKITRSDIDNAAIHSLFLSSVEIELFIYLAQEALYLGDTATAHHVCQQISSYLSARSLSFLERDRLLAENAVVYTKYLLTVCDYKSALELSNFYRHQMISNLDDGLMHELTFLTALGCYYTGQQDRFLTLFKTAFFSAHSINSCYATICKNYVSNHLSTTLAEDLNIFSDISLISFSPKVPRDVSSMGDGTYDFFSHKVFTLGGLIRSLRKEQKLSQSALCRGLCSKSKLSKIENETQQPDIILAQTLLQRLGISDLVFTFYGSEKENKLQELQFRLAKTRMNHKTLQLDLVKKMEMLCTSKDICYLQFAAYKSAICEPDNNQKLKGLKNALFMTLPGFQFDEILDYRLSWIELTILNNICRTYATINPTHGIYCFYKLLEYTSHVPLDVLEKKRSFPVTLGMLIRFLYTENRLSEIVALVPLFSDAISSMYFTGNIFSHYCQALGSLGLANSAKEFAHYAYYNALLMEDIYNASGLKNDLKKNYNISLL